MVSKQRNLQFLNGLAPVLSVFLVLMTLAGSLTISSCGTEVGNGFSGPGADPDDKRKKTATTDSKTTQESQAAPDEGSNTDTVASDAAGAPERMPTNAPVGLGIDPGVLMAPCGSPFGEKLVSPISLTNNMDTAIAATISGSEWTVSANSEVVGFVSAGDKGPYTVNSLGPDRAPYPAAYTCSAIVEANGVVIAGVTGSVSRRVVTITNESIVTQVTWYVKPGATASDAKTLVQIEISNAQGSRVLSPPKSP
jgi:hypothetical protein